MPRTSWDPNLIGPKFLTKEMAEEAVQSVLDLVFNSPEDSPLKKMLKPKRQQCHVVVVVPGRDIKLEYDAGYAPLLLYQYSHKEDDDAFIYPFPEIALSKAEQLWEDRNDDRTDIQPHLLFQGETPFWGGVKRHGIVVTCSGIQPWLDKMISGMVADMLIAMSYNAYMESDDKKNGESFLTPAYLQNK